MADQRLPLAWQPVSPALMDALSPTTAYQDTERLRRYSSKVARDQHRSKVVDALLDTWPAQIAKSAWGAFTLPGDVYAGKVDPLSDEGVQRSADLAGFVTLGAGAIPAEANSARAGIKVYHGSPHDFDKFELSDKTIGTGEGAQAYGHGLYFAENEDVAHAYKYATAAKNRKVTFDGKPLNDSRDWWSIQDKLESEDWKLRKAFDTIQSNMGQGYNPEEAIKFAKDWYRNQPDMLNAIDNVSARMNVEVPAGHFYEAELDASPDNFLDWDKPLSEQSPKVKEALKQFGFGSKEEHDFYKEAIDMGWDEEAARVFAKKNAGRDYATGAHIYESKKIVPGEYSDSVEAAKRLRAAGIKGIRYKDAGSRAKEGGTSNYVVFDDNIINILRKYGIAGLIGGAAGAGAMTTQPGTAEARESR